jgi:signal transduction histidine kinase
MNPISTQTPANSMSVREVRSTPTPTTGEHAAVSPSSPFVVAQRSPEQLAGAYDALPVAVVVAWHDGRLTLNAAARRLLTRASAGSLQAHFAELSVRDLAGKPIGIEQFPLSRALCGESVSNARLVVRAIPDLGSDDLEPSDRTWTVDANPVRSGSEIRGAIAIYRDVTDRVADEEMGDELLGTAAHDLRTPLTALKACVQLIERGLDRLDPTARARTLSLLVGQVDKLSSKVDDVLDAARMRRGRVDMTPVDLDVSRELGEIIVEACKAPGAPACDVHIPPGLQAHTDPARLRQVMRSILLEAGDRTSRERPVVVRAFESAQGIEIVIETKPARESSRSRTMRRLARRLVERLGGSARDALDQRGSIQFTLPRASGGAP